VNAKTSHILISYEGFPNQKKVEQRRSKAKAETI
jgi:hypothetical protein